MIPYGRHHLDEDDIQAVVDVLRSGSLTQGPKIAEFEAAIASYVGAQYAVAVSSGTAALHIAAKAAGVQAGDEIITSPITFVASANCAVYCGARPIFADIDPKTYNISPEDLSRRITRSTRAVIPVHFAGQSCDMKSIRQVVSDAEHRFGRKITIIEDASHALGSCFKNTSVGSGFYSDMTVFSFHPVKHVTTGEGGAILTQDPKIYRKLKLLRSHGITSEPEEFRNLDMAFQPQEPGNRNPWYYEQIDLGYNYRITDIQCALGTSQLRKLDLFKERRRAIVDRYNTLFHGFEQIQTPHEAIKGSSNFHLYVLLFDFGKLPLDRARLMIALRQRGIQTQVHYIPVHLHSFYRQTFGYRPGDYPNAEAYYKGCLSIPLFPAMSDDDIVRVHEEIIRLTAIKG